jgi:hypothetical protein
LQHTLFVVGRKRKMTLKVHSIVEDSHDFYRPSARRAVHQKVASTPTVPSDVERAKARHDLISILGARNIGAIGECANRLNEQVPVDARLAIAKILRGPFDDIRKVEFCGSAETNAPFSLDHWRNLFDGLGNDLLGEAIQISLQFFHILEFFEFASFQGTNTDPGRFSLLASSASRCSTSRNPSRSTSLAFW